MALPVAAGAKIVDTATPVRPGFDGLAAAPSANAPRVLFVDQSGQLGGAELCLLPLAARWAARHEVMLLSDGPFRERLEAQGVTVALNCSLRTSAIRKDQMRLRWLAALPGMLRQSLALARHARRYDVVMLNTQKALVLGAFSKPLHGKPVVFYLHDIVSSGHFGKLQRFAIKWLTRLAVDRVVANSAASATSIAALTGLPLESIPVVHNGVDLNAFAPHAEEDTGALRRRLGLPEHAVLAGLFGRLAPWKGQHVALDALARLPDVHLVLVGSALFGEDAYVDALRAQAQRLGIAKRVHFAGFQDEMYAWMRAMDVILHTSTQPEPFGRVVIEGMASGRPVIASAAGGVLEIVEHDRNGWLVEPDNSAALAAAIDALLAAPDTAKRLAGQAIVDVAERFSLDIYVARMTQAIVAAAR